MRTGITVDVSAADRARLEAIVADRNSPQKHVWRARIVLLTADGLGTNEIMRRTGKSKTCVWRWQERFMHEGVDGLLRDKTRPSRVAAARRRHRRARRRADAERSAGRDDPLDGGGDGQAAGSASPRCSASGARMGSSRIGCGSSSCRATRNSSPSCATSSGSMSIRRRTRSCSASTRNSQIQALDRTQPGLPLKPGRCGTMTHDYKRNGTTTLFAALDVLEGKVIGRCMQRHRHQEFIRFLNAIEAEIPVGKIIHVILDNYGPHKHPKVRAWLGRHPRFVFHYTPTSGSWLNAVEGFFAKLTKRRLKRGVFCSIVDLQAAINRFLRETNDDPKTLHLDRRSRQNHRRRQTRAPSVKFDPLAASARLNVTLVPCRILEAKRVNAFPKHLFDWKNAAGTWLLPIGSAGY